MSEYDILMYNVTPFEIHIHFNNLGYYNHFIYRVYVTKNSVWFNKYVIVADMMEGYDFRKFFYTFCDHLIMKSYKTEARRRLDIGMNLVDHQINAFIGSSESMIDEVIRNAIHRIKNQNIVLGLRVLVNVIENKDYNYLLYRYKIKDILEGIIFSDSSSESDKLVAITGIRLLVENQALLFFPDTSKYHELTRPLYEYKVGPYENCPYFHGTLNVNKAKEILSSVGLPGYYMIFAPDCNFKVSYLLFFKEIIGDSKVFSTEKITYNEDDKFFYIKKKGYKSVDKYVVSRNNMHLPFIRPVKPLLIAYEALRVIEPKVEDEHE
jgi:hypothetical protein